MLRNLTIVLLYNLHILAADQKSFVFSSNLSDLWATFVTKSNFWLFFEQLLWPGTAEGEGRPTTFIAWIYYLALQLTRKKYGFFNLKVINAVYSCIFASRQRLGCHERDAHKTSQKCAVIIASTIARLVGEPTLLRKRRAPARLEVSVGAFKVFSQTAKDHL